MYAKDMRWGLRSGVWLGKGFKINTEWFSEGMAHGIKCCRAPNIGENWMVHTSRLLNVRPYLDE